MDTHTQDDPIKAERQRIAKMLHNTLTQSLFAASTIASALPQMLEKRPELVEEYIDKLNQELAHSAQQLQTIMTNLNADEHD